jgi:hypothetical protein
MVAKSVVRERFQRHESAANLEATGSHAQAQGRNVVGCGGKWGKLVRIQQHASSQPNPERK